MEYLTFIYELLVCFTLSFLIGFERQYRRRYVGLRTIILVGIGSFLFVNYSNAFQNSDMNRIAAQVVAGIGFLGAGVIIKDEKSVKGLTTAATLWCAAAIGVLCGANMLIEAAIGTLVILFTNTVLRKVNAEINKHTNTEKYDTYYFKIVCNNSKEDIILEKIKKVLTDTKSELVSAKIIDETESTTQIDLCIANTSKTKDLASKIMEQLTERNDIKSISMDKKETIELMDEEEL